MLQGNDFRGATLVKVQHVQLLQLEDREVDQLKRNFLIHYVQELESMNQRLQLDHKVPICELHQLCNTKLYLNHLDFCNGYDQRSLSLDELYKSN